MRHISIDLETFDNYPDAAIASIGAVTSDGGEFYAVVEDPNGSYSPRTIRWHLAQENSSSNIGEDEQVQDLQSALERFAAWLHEYGANQEGSAALWTHATFDMPILSMAYRRAGLPRPWHHRNCRDLRTLYDLSGGRPPWQEHGDHHALNDARYQLKEVQTCLARMRD